jgi:hypothetical protein
MTRPLSHVPLHDQISCVRREIAMRIRVYPRMVETRAMTQEWADFQIAQMQAVLATLEALQAQNEPQLSLLEQEK